MIFRVYLVYFCLVLLLILFYFIYGWVIGMMFVKIKYVFSFLECIEWDVVGFVVGVSSFVLEIRFLVFGLRNVLLFRWLDDILRFFSLVARLLDETLFLVIFVFEGFVFMCFYKV